MPPTDPVPWPTDPWFPARPPTQDELPYDDGEPMESDKHRLQMWLLCECARRGIAPELNAYAAGNMGLYYTTLQAKKNEFKAPDFFVVLGAEPGLRKSWVIWDEGRAPDLVVEILSPSTEREDRGRKMSIYARGIRVPEYYLFDPYANTVEGYQLDTATLNYAPMERQADGGFCSNVIGLRLVVWHGHYFGQQSDWLRLAYPDGTLVPTDEEHSAWAARQAEAEKSRAEAEKSRADRLAEKLRALGIDPEA